MKRLGAVLCAFAALEAGANTLGDVKTAVSRLDPKQPVHATFAVDQKVKSAGRFANEDTALIASAEVTHDANGVSIVIPQALLDKASQEIRSRAASHPAQGAIGTLRSTTIVEALDYRDALLEMLDRATVKEEKRVLLAGKQTRLLVLSLRPTARQESGTIRIGTVKTDDQLRLWIGDDNVPVAGEHVLTSTAGFMFLHGTYGGRTKYPFAHTPD